MNLKASAVAWLKDEIIAADKTIPVTATPSLGIPESANIFASPVIIRELAPYLFTDLWESLAAPAKPIIESWSEFKQAFPLLLQTLNFYYFLLTATHLHSRLDILDGDLNATVELQYVAPLRKVYYTFLENLDEDGELSAEEGKEGKKIAMGDLRLVEVVLEGIDSRRRELGL